MTRRELSSEELGRALDAWKGIEPSASLLRSVARVPLDHPRTEPGRLSIWQLFKPFGLSFAAGAAGIWVGLIQAPELKSGQSDRVEIVAGSEVEADTEWEELAQL